VTPSRGVSKTRDFAAGPQANWVLLCNQGLNGGPGYYVEAIEDKLLTLTPYVERAMLFAQAEAETRAIEVARKYRSASSCVAMRHPSL